MSNKEIKELWGDDLYKVFANHIDKDGWLTSEWSDIIECEIPRFDKNYNDNELHKNTYMRMYNIDFEESEDGKFIRRVKDNYN